MNTPTSPNFIYSIKQFRCQQCNTTGKITEQENDGTPFLLCLACGYKEIIPKFRHNTLDKLQYIRKHSNNNSPTLENITK
jgi:Zn ribbon nucleic-acid-binding protein